MAALAAPKRKRAAKHGPPGGGTQAPPKPKRGLRGVESAAVGVLQPKLRVNEPDDQFEREADRVADRVLSMPQPQARSGVPAGREMEESEQASVQRQAAEEEEAEAAQTASLQRREDEGEEEKEEAQTSSLQRQETDPEAEREETAQTSALQRQEEEEEPDQAQTASLQRRTDEEEERMQQRAKRHRRPHITPQFEAGLKLLRHGGGQPLPEPLRAFLEPRFGRSLADVRAHDGPEAATLAREANARAFTVGRHIVFGAGEYRPGVEQGRRLIAHELTHVFQQRGGLHSVQREVGPDRAVDTQRPQPADLEELRAAFDLRPRAAPASVLSIALELLRGALGNQTDAERLKPLTTTEAGAVVRRIESSSYTLELAARHGGGGMAASWTLTRRDKRQSFVSRSNSAAQQWPGASQGADVETISVTAPPANQYPEETLAGRLESDRLGVEAPPDKPPPLLPEAVPADSVPGPKAKPPYKAPSTDEAAPAPEVESGTKPEIEPLTPTSARPPDVPGTPAPAEAATTEAGAAGQAVTEEPAAEGGEPVEEEAHAPRTPEEDPDFQETVAKVVRTRNAQAAHPPPTRKQKETSDASFLPEEQQRGVNDRDAHFDKIGATAEQSKEPKKHFTAEDFKETLATSIKEISLPKNEDEAKNFKSKRPLEAAKQGIRGQVQEQNQKIVGPLANQVAVERPPASDKPELVTKPGELVEEKAGGRPAPISSSAAAPKPRLDNEISFEKESASLDHLMAENDMTEEQLAVSNEPQFVQALNSKKQAQQKAAEAPGVYREGEQKVLEEARDRAGHAGAKGFGGMFKTREGAFTTVFSKQSSTAAADKAEQSRIQERLAGIYARTKSDVDGTLELLTKAVESIFSIQVGLAMSTFESRVEDQLDEIYGWTVIDDKISDFLFGEDTEAIDAVFNREKERFLKTMDTVIDQIAQLIATFLNAAILRVETGRQEAKEFYEGLTKEQQRLTGEAYKAFQLQFDTLEDSVREKEQELADTLAESYHSNVVSLRESFDKIKEEISRGWIGGAIDFVKGVAKVIYKLGQLLYSVLSRIANVVGEILAHPIRFIENLASGIGAGFAQFIKKIDEYLVAGFFEWLRGSAGPAIKLPDKFDAAGLFDLIAQVLGLTYENFRRIAVKVWGKAAVELLETGVAVAEKGLEIVQLVREKRLAGLWEYIQASLSSLVEELIQKVKQTVLYAAIEKALAFVATLFTPVGAFIKAAQTIYRGIRFLMDNIDRIAEIVDAFLSSVELAVAGKTDVIAQKIVTALRKFIVVGIDFLAKLLGLGDLAAKVRKVLKAISAPFERAVEAVLKGLKSLVKGVMRKLGIGSKGEKKTRAQKRREKEKRKTAKLEKKGQRPLSHREVVTQVVSAMSKPTKAKTPAAALAEKQTQAQSLTKQYQPLLKKGQLRIVITDPSVKQVEEDAAVDFDVSASPGKKGEARVALAAATPHANDGRGKILVGDTGPYRSVSRRKDPRYKADRVKHPFLALVAEHVLPRAIVDRIVEAMGFQGMPRIGAEYRNAETIAIYEGAARIKTDRYDNPTLRTVESEAKEIAAPLRVGSSDPETRSAAHAERGSAADAEKAATAHGELTELINRHVQLSIPNTMISVTEEDNTNRGARGNDAALPQAGKVSQVASSEGKQATRSLLRLQAFMERAAAGQPANNPINLAIELNRLVGRKAEVTSDSVNQATVKWDLEYQNWTKDQTETLGKKRVRVNFERHAGRVTWSIQPFGMESAGNGEAVDTSALAEIQQALARLRGELENAARARRDEQPAAAGASAAASPGPATPGGDSGASA
jgi:hypothetical protein